MERLLSKEDERHKHKLLKKGFLFVAFFIITLLCGCAKNTTGPQKTAEEFLYHFYSFNEDDRYNILMENLLEWGEHQTSKKDGDLPLLIGMSDEELSNAMVSYNDAFYKLCTDDYIKGAIANRMPFKYERIVAEAGEEVRVTDIELSFSQSRDNSFYYTVNLEIINNAGSRVLTAKGRVDLVEVEKEEFRVNINVVTGIYEDDGKMWP